MEPHLESWLHWLAPEPWQTEITAEVIGALRGGQSPQRIVKTYEVDLAGVERLKRALETHELIPALPPLTDKPLVKLGTAVAKFSAFTAILAWLGVVALIGFRQAQLHIAVNAGAWLARAATSASGAEIIRAAKLSFPAGEYQALQRTVGGCLIEVGGRYLLTLPGVGPIELRSSAASCGNDN